MKKRKNKEKKKLNIYKFASIVQILITLGFAALLLVLDILPLKYLAIALGSLFILDMLGFIILFKSKLKKGIKKFFLTISIIISLILLLGSAYLYKTFGVINNMMDDEYKTYNYSVIVLKDAKYEQIDDLQNLKIGYYETKGTENQLSLEKLNKVVKNVNQKYTNLEDLANDLLNSNIPAIILEDSYKKSLSSDSSGENSYSKIQNFENKTKVIYKFKVKVKVDDTSKSVDVTKKPFNIYISGIDTYGEVSSVSRSDVNIVVTVNPKTKQVLLTSIPRDYYVQLYDTTGYKDKLTHAGIYGTDKSIKTIENLLDIDINYYFKVNFTSLMNIVNALGGVDVYSDQTFTAWNGYHFTKGYNSVNGTQALAFVRERHSFTNGDRERGIHQQALIDAMLRKCMSKTIITKYSNLLDSIKGNIITNMPTKTMMSLVKMQLKDNASWTISANSLDGTGSLEYTYSYQYQRLYVMVPNKEKVQEAKNLITSVVNGQVLEASFDQTSSDIHSVQKYATASKSTSSTKKTTTKKKTTTNNTTKETQVLPEEQTKTDETTTTNNTTEGTQVLPEEQTKIDETTTTNDDNASKVPEQTP